MVYCVSLVCQNGFRKHQILDNYTFQKLAKMANFGNFAKATIKQNDQKWPILGENVKGSKALKIHVLYMMVEYVLTDSIK